MRQVLAEAATGRELNLGKTGRLTIELLKNLYLLPSILTPIEKDQQSLNYV